MTKNSWQTGDINGRAHAIEKCGSHTGHAVREVAFCDTPETAQLLVQALYLLKSVLDSNVDHRSEEIAALLDRAGIM